MKQYAVFLSLLLIGCGTNSSESEETDTTQTKANPSLTTSGKRKGDSDKLAPEDPVFFETIGAESGFDFQRFDDTSGRKRILEVNGGGVGIIDYDGDLWPDILMTNGCKLPLSLDSRDTPSALFRNQKEMTFAKRSDEAALMQFGFATGCSVADVDADGFDDLFVAAYGPNQIWMNNGDGTFRRSVLPAVEERWSTSAAFFDFNGDNLPDLYIANYLDESDTAPTLCPNPSSPTGFEGCPPSMMKGQADQLYLNDGVEGFTDVSDEVGLSGHVGKGLGVAIADFDGDMTFDIYVANDGEANFLFVQEGSTDGKLPRLKDVAPVANVALNESGFAQASMGIAVSDFDKSGLPDIFLTHFFSDTNTLYSNQSVPGELLFMDTTRSSRLGIPSRQTLGFGVEVIDVNSDGWDDLFIANGHIDDRTWAKTPEPYKMKPQLFLNTGGQFRNVSETSGTYFQTEWLGRGVAKADFDRDFRFDLIVSHQLDVSRILKNVAAPSVSEVFARTRSIQSASPTVSTVYGGSFQSATSQDFVRPKVSRSETRHSDLMSTGKDGLLLRVPL